MIYSPEIEVDGYTLTGTRQEVLEKVLEWKKHPNLGQLFNESNPLSFVQTHGQFGITYIPDIL
jgi:hypothetical protein